MTTGADILLGDTRKALEKAVANAIDVDLADKGFAAWLLGWSNCPFDIIAITAAAVECRTRGYRDVAALGFLAELTFPACSFQADLSEGLTWLSKRPTKIVGSVAGFVSDSVGLLGVALGASRCGEPELKATIATWLQSVCSARSALPAFTSWETCLFSAAAHKLDREELVPTPKTPDSADCRIALRSLGALPQVYPAEVHADEKSFLNGLMSEDVGSLSFTRIVLKAAAYDAIKRGMVVGGAGGTLSVGSATMQANNSDNPPKKVFVSYSWEPDAPEYQPRVLRFAQDLRRYGLNATMDLFEQHPPEGLPRWMLKQIRDSDFVLMFITETYRKRFEGDDEPGKGKGVKWEGGVITRNIYDSEFHNRKFIPVLFGTKYLSSMPTILVGDTYYDVTAPERLEALVRYMTDQPAYVPVPVGRTPVLPPRSVPD